MKGGEHDHVTDAVLPTAFRAQLRVCLFHRVTRVILPAPSAITLIPLVTHRWGCRNKIRWKSSSSGNRYKAGTRLNRQRSHLPGNPPRHEIFTHHRQYTLWIHLHWLRRRFDVRWFLLVSCSPINLSAFSLFGSLCIQCYLFFGRVSSGHRYNVIGVWTDTIRQSLVSLTVFRLLFSCGSRQFY